VARRKTVEDSGSDASGSDGRGEQGALAAAFRVRVRTSAPSKAQGQLHDLPQSNSAIESALAALSSEADGVAGREVVAMGEKHIVRVEAKELPPSAESDVVLDEDSSDETSSSDSEVESEAAPASAEPAVPPELNVRSRYFASEVLRTGLSRKCFNCGQTGHLRAECPHGHIPVPCMVCGGTDHMHWKCPVRRELVSECDAIRSDSHRSQSAPRAQRNQLGTFAAACRFGSQGLCPVCGMTTHSVRACPYAGDLDCVTSVESRSRGLPRDPPLDLSVSLDLRPAKGRDDNWAVDEAIQFTVEAAKSPAWVIPMAVASSAKGGPVSEAAWATLRQRAAKRDRPSEVAPKAPRRKLNRGLPA
jgi:cellular nucleic acid-binding protein